MGAPLCFFSVCICGHGFVFFVCHIMRFMANIFNSNNGKNNNAIVIVALVAAILQWGNRAYT